MIRRIIVLFLGVLLISCTFFATNKNSLENIDYAVAIRIDVHEANDDERRWDITLFVADLMEYKGSSMENLNTEEYKYELHDIKTALDRYEEENRRKLSLSHGRKIIIVPDPSASEMIQKREVDDVLLELTSYMDLSSRVKVNVKYGEDEKVMNFREAVRKINIY